MMFMNILLKYFDVLKATIASLTVLFYNHLIITLLSSGLMTSHQLESYMMSRVYDGVAHDMACRHLKGGA